MKINILPPSLANKIAAGEVVERPASVVKELVENSIDAGAKHIHVHITKSGVAGIEITDDGSGIEQSDLPLALASHATSKIQTVDDLMAIHSLGFRGEALASIAAVSRFSITSRTQSSDKAYAIDNQDTTVIKSAAHPVGTTVSVRDLFFNVPARYKFLRSNKTEFGHIEETVRRTALSRFDVGFTLTHDKRVMFRLPIAHSLLEKEKRIGTLLGNAFLKHSFHMEMARNNLILQGWVATADVARSQNDRQYCFINNRVIRDKLLHHGIRQGYEACLPAGRYPCVVLYLTCDPASVDVNVHPTKHEVRFRDARSVHDFICLSIKAVLAQAQDSDVAQQAEKELSADVEQVAMASSHQIINAYQRADLLKRFTQRRVDKASDGTVQAQQHWQPLASPRPRTASMPAAPMATSKQHTQQVSVFLQRYIFFERDAQLYALDAKTLHTTWLIQQFHAHIGAKTLREQPLLVPVRYKPDKSLMPHWTDYQEKLKTVGITAAILDVDTIVVRYIPALLHGIEVNRLIEVALKSLRSKSDAWQRALITEMADLAGQGICNAHLNTDKAHTLLNQLNALQGDTSGFVYPITSQILASWFSKTTLQKEAIE